MAKTDQALFDKEKTRVLSGKGIKPSTDLTKRSIANPDAGSYVVGDVYLTKDHLSAEDIFENGNYVNRNGESALFMLTECKHGETVRPKQVYFSALLKSVPEYALNEDREAVATGVIYSANGITGTKNDAKANKDIPAVCTTFYQDMLACANVQEQLDLLVSHKGFKVNKVISVDSARFQNGNIVGVRKQNLPLFEWVDLHLELPV